MAAAPRPLTPAAFAPLIERFGLFEPCPHLAVAVSGGRDSMALVHLADAWAKGRGGSATALIVDHGLRAASAQEAAATRANLQDCGIATALLHADGPATGNLQAWARRQRYALMNAWCRRHGVLHLLVAHHAHDLAETVLAALTRDAGLAGTAGMAAVRELPDCRLLRPLLDVPRDRLEATLARRGIDWIDDPSNRDRRFRRVRLRARLSGSHETALLAQRALRAGQARQDHERRVADLLATSLRIDGETLSVARAPLAAVDPEIATMLVAASVRWVGRRVEPPRQARLEAATAWVLGPETGGQRTLGGCTLTLGDGRLSVCRHPDRTPHRRRRKPAQQAPHHAQCPRTAQNAHPLNDRQDQPAALFAAAFGALPLTEPFGKSKVVRVG